MRISRYIAVLIAVALIILALPALAIAHPSTYSTTARSGKAAELQTITVDATGGTFEPSADASAVSFDAGAAAVQAALWRDPAIGPGSVAVSGPAGGPYQLTFSGTLLQVDVPQVVPDGSGLTGGSASAIAATVVQGNGPNITYPAAHSLLPTQEVYVVTNHGYALVYRETNGLTTGGYFDLKRLPNGYRATMTPAEWLQFPEIQAGAQAHATCQNVAALDTSTVLASQSNPAQPFFNYIPWQKTSAGLDDDPADWIPDVLTATGVDLSTLETPADFRAACEGLGGTYHPSDLLQSSIAPAMVADAVAAATDPLNATITQLQDQITTLEGEVASLLDEVSNLEDQLTDIKDRPLTLTLTAGRFRLQTITAMVTGTVGDEAIVTASLPAKLAAKLKLSSPVIGTASTVFDERGAALLHIKPTSEAIAALAGRTTPTTVTIEATADGQTLTATATLVTA